MSGPFDPSLRFSREALDFSRTLVILGDGGDAAERLPVLRDLTFAATGALACLGDDAACCSCAVASGAPSSGVVLLTDLADDSARIIFTADVILALTTDSSARSTEVLSFVDVADVADDCAGITLTADAILLARFAAIEPGGARLVCTTFELGSIHQGAFCPYDCVGS